MPDTLPTEEEFRSWLADPTVSEEAKSEALRLMSEPRLTRYIAERPTQRQQEFLMTEAKEAFYGGAAGGGKSSALLSAALQYADCPGYSALILRRTFAQLSKPGALLDRSQEWLKKTDARWNSSTHIWTFPSGAKLEFGHVENDNDRYNYQSAEYDLIAFDELSQFTEIVYTYLFSRLRRRALSNIPLRMRSASNPGGTGHEWVKKRFISDRKAGIVFVPAKLKDNPHVDAVTYIASLDELDSVTKSQLLAGDWDAYEGGRFQKHWFKKYRSEAGKYFLEKNVGIETLFHNHCWRATACDNACSEKDLADYTAIVTCAVTPKNDILVLNVRRGHYDVDDIPVQIANVCANWQPLWVGIEANQFQIAIANAARRRTDIPSVRNLYPKGKGKLVRATPAIIRAEHGQVYLPHEADWLADFLDELIRFTGDDDKDGKRDQVDAFAYLVQEIDRTGSELVPPELHVQEKPPIYQRMRQHGFTSNAARRHLNGRR